MTLVARRRNPSYSKGFICVQTLSRLSAIEVRSPTQRHVQRSSLDNRSKSLCRGTSDLIFTQLSGGPIAAAILHTTQNAQNLVGGGSAGFGFDVDLGWTTSSGTGRF